MKRNSLLAGLALMCALASCGDRTRVATADGGPSPDGGGGRDAATSRWSLLSPITDPDLINFVAFQGMGRAGTDLYVVGTAGFVLRSSDEGETWANIGLPHDATRMFPCFTSFAGTPEGDVWVGGFGTGAYPGTSNDGILLHRPPGGVSWQTIPVGDGRRIEGVWAIDRERVLVATQAGEIWRTTDSGTTWTRVFFDPLTTPINFWSPGGSVLYAAGALAMAADAGNPDAGNPDAGAADSGTTRRLSGVVLRSSDAGATWTAVLTTAPCNFWHIAGTPDGRTIYAAGDCGTVAWSEDHGDTWSSTGDASRASRSNRRFPILGVWITSKGRRYFALDQEVCESVIVNDNIESRGGCEPLPWRPYAENSNARSIASPQGIWGMADDDIWVHGAGGFLWRRR